MGPWNMGSSGVFQEWAWRCPVQKKNPLSTFHRPAQTNKGNSLPSVCCGMHISTVLDLHRFVRRLYEAPELALDVMLCHADVAEHVGRPILCIYVVLFRGVRLEPPPAEFAVACMKTGQRVLLALVETKIPSSAKYASWAEPLPTRHGRKRGF